MASLLAIAAASFSKWEKDLFGKVGDRAALDLCHRAVRGQVAAD